MTASNNIDANTILNVFIFLFLHCFTNFLPKIFIKSWVIILKIIGKFFNHYFICPLYRFYDEDSLII